MIKAINKILLFINIFFLESYLLKLSIFNYPANLQEILIGLNLITFFVQSFLQKNIKKDLIAFKKQKITIALLILSLISVAINYPLASNIDFIRYYKFFFFAAILVYIFLRTFKNSTEKDQGLKVMSIGALAFALFSIIYNLTGHNVAEDNRLLGPLDSAVYMAYYLAPGFLYFSIKWLKTKEKEYLKYALLTFIPLIFTRSMGSFVAIFLVLFLYTLKHYGKTILNNKIIRIGGIAALTLLIIAVTYTKIIPTLKYNNSSLDERGEIWQTAGQLIQKTQTVLFGLGPNQFQANYKNNVKEAIGKEPLDYYVLQPHNIFLLFQFNYGLPGLLFLLYLIYINGINLRRKKIGEYLEICNFILLYFFIHGLIDTPIIKNDMFFIFLLMLESAVPLELPLFKSRSQIH